MQTLGSGRRRGRAVAPVVGLVLLLGIVVAGSGIVFVTGMEAKASVEDAAAVDSVESTLRAAGATFASVAHAGHGAAATVDFDEIAEDVDVEADGEVRVRLNGQTACTATTDLGTVVAEHDSGVTLAYQAGAVFRQSASGTTVVQSPALDYRTESMNGTPIRTLSFPIPNVTGDVRGTGAVVASTDASTDGFQDDLCLTEDGAVELGYVREVTITVTGSDYYRAWHRYFEREFGVVADHDVDHATKTASVTAPLGAGVRPNQFVFDDVRIYGAVFSTASSGELLLQTKHATVDSYDSTAGPWGGSEPTYGDDGEVFTRGKIVVQANGASVAGDVYAEGSVSLSQSCASDGEHCVDGDVFVNNSTPTGPTTALFPADDDERAERIGGTWGNGTNLPTIPAMDDTIDETVATASTYNTNDDEPAVSEAGIQYASGSATVETGVYHLDDLAVPAGNTLVFDTTDGDVVLAADGDATIGADATVRVKGDGRVHVFLGESASAGDQLHVGDGATVEVVESGTRTYRSTAFVLACKAGCSATFADAAPTDPTTFTGVLYGPGGPTDDGTVSLGKHVDVWGALVAGSVTFEQQASFHFDERLRNQVADRDGDGAPDVQATSGLAYVEPAVENGYVVTVTKHDVNVTDDNPRIAERNVRDRAAAAGDGFTTGSQTTAVTAKQTTAVTAKDSITTARRPAAALLPTAVDD